MKVWGLPPELGLVVGMVGAALLGLVMGVLAIRRQGIYFAMVTLALSQMFFFFCLQAPFTHGEDGIQGVPRGHLLGFIDLYHERIKAFHVKDAEFNPSPKQGVYSGFQPWLRRAGRFRSLGDGQIDFGGIFSRLAGYDYGSWAVLEWECCLKHPEDGAREGAAFVRRHIIRTTPRAFDDFAAQDVDGAAIDRAMGLA